MKTREEFLIKVGRYPENDDLERVNCPDQGGFGHRQCGWCDIHDLPRFECGCSIKVLPKGEIYE